MTKYTTMSTLLALLATGLLGCGGGSDTPAPTTPTPGGPMLTNAVFNGTYLFTYFSTRHDPAMPGNRDYQAEVGEFMANGMGSWTQSVGSNDNDDGVVSVGVASPAVPYSVASDGTFTLLSGFTTGGFASDGSAGVSAPNNAALDPHSMTLMRLDGVGMSNASLAGNYHVAQIFAKAAGTNPTALWTSNVLGLMAFDGSGVTTIPTMNGNSAGAVGTNAGATPPGYMVMPNGRVQIYLLNGTYVGALAADGAFALLGGGSIAPQDPQIAVMVKESLLLTNAAFSGSYWAVGVSSDPTDMSRWTSFVGSVTADGAGAMNFVSTTEALEKDAGGSTISNPTGADTYTVQGDGTITTPSGRSGAITADGRFAYLSGSTMVGDGPLLFVFIKK